MEILSPRRTEKVLFKKAIFKTSIGSQECLQKYLGTAKVQKKLSEDEGWLD